MDNKQFLQRLLSDPFAAQGHTETDAQRRALIQKVQQQEQQLRQTIEVPVPPELLTRLLEQQRRLEANETSTKPPKAANDNKNNKMKDTDDKTSTPPIRNRHIFCTKQNRGCSCSIMRYNR